MKPAIIAEIERIAGDRLDASKREEIADAVIKIIEGAALAAVEIVKQSLVQAADKSAAKGSK